MFVLKEMAVHVCISFHGLCNPLTGMATAVHILDCK